MDEMRRRSRRLREFVDRIIVATVCPFSIKNALAEVTVAHGGMATEEMRKRAQEMLAQDGVAKHNFAFTSPRAANLKSHCPAPLLSTTMRTRSRKRARESSISQVKPAVESSHIGNFYGPISSRAAFWASDLTAASGHFFCQLKVTATMTAGRKTHQEAFKKTRTARTNDLGPLKKDLLRLQTARLAPLPSLAPSRSPTTMPPTTTTTTTVALPLQSKTPDERRARRTSSADLPWTWVSTGARQNANARWWKLQKLQNNFRMLKRRQKKRHVLTIVDSASNVSLPWRTSESDATLKKTSILPRVAQHAAIQLRLRQVVPDSSALAPCMGVTLPRLSLLAKRSRQKARETRTRMRTYVSLCVGRYVPVLFTHTLRVEERPLATLLMGHLEENQGVAQAAATSQGSRRDQCCKRRSSDEHEEAQPRSRETPIRGRQRGRIRTEKRDPKAPVQLVRSPIS